MAKIIVNSAQMEHVRKLRWRARSDLFWLCSNILEYKLLNPRVHGPMIEHLQQFPVPQDWKDRDKILPNGKFEYTPHDPYTYLRDPRRRVLLFSRGYFKTSVNTIAHTIQWLLNFPQIAIADLFSVDGKAQDILSNSIKHHFQFNQQLRELFPEYCPQRRVGDWGNSEAFTLENRDDVLRRLELPPRVEPSVMAQSLDKGQAGYHFDIIKCSDIVEENNVSTPAQMERVKKRFGLLPKMLVKRPDGEDGWLDLEGTFYHPADLHADMIKQWLAEGTEPDTHHTWSIFINGCFERETGGTPRTYDPSELLLPFKVDLEGKRVPTWSEADPIGKLEREEVDPREGGYVFATQRVLDFKADKSGGRPFEGPVTWIKRQDFQSVPIVYRMTTVDLADTDGPKSNHSVILTCAYDRMGRCYVEDIQRGKWGPDEVVTRLFTTYEKFKPSKVVVEDYAYVHGLKPTIERKSIVSKVYPPFEYIPADRTTTKHKRIILALQTPFKSGLNGQPDLRFVDPLDPESPERSREVKTALETEFQEATVFAMGTSDDILDALANQFLSREWLGTLNLGGAHTQTPEAQRRLVEEEYRAAQKRMFFPDHEALSAKPDDFMRATGW